MLLIVFVLLQLRKIMKTVSERIRDKWLIIKCYLNLSVCFTLLCMKQHELPVTREPHVWKLGNVREFDSSQRNVRKLTKSRGKCYKKLLRKTVYCQLVFGAVPVFTSVMGTCLLYC